MKKITRNKINEVCAESKLVNRKRKNFNYHDDLSDSLQRLLNAMQPGTYIQPHKHENPDKREAFIILTGKVLVVTFDDEGKILDHILLSQENGNYGVEIPERTWHSLIILEEDSVVYEVKDGPYSPISDKNFAPWAPAENEIGCSEYNQSILNQLGIEPY
jgi:cupin fold WbuC family metalloprotein